MCEAMKVHGGLVYGPGFRLMRRGGLLLMDTASQAVTNAAMRNPLAEDMEPSPGEERP